MSTDSTWTVLRLLEWTTQYLRERGSESPRLDAEILLAACRDCPRIELYTAFEEEASPSLRDRFRELVRRRAEGCPVAYLTEQREFFSRPFKVTPEVLIPRPETEFVVTTLLDLVDGNGGRNREWFLADVATGSGILAVTCGLELPLARIVATDISPVALDVARQNVEHYGLNARIDLQLGNLLAVLPEERQLDFVLSNPPYVSESEFSELPATVRDFEPRTALVAGPRGDEVIARLLPEAALRLKRGGWLILEISPMIESRVREHFAADPSWSAPVMVRDLARLPRVIYSRYAG